MSRLILDVTSIPTLTNGGLVVIVLLILALLGLWLLTHPPVFRCKSCPACFDSFAELAAHVEAAGVHTTSAPRPPRCSCGGGGRFHHPACP